MLLFFISDLHISIFWFFVAQQLDTTGRPDENLSMEVIGPLWLSTEETSQNKRLLSMSLQKGQLRANVCYQPQHSANLEVSTLIYSRSFWS